MAERKWGAITSLSGEAPRKRLGGGYPRREERGEEDRGVLFLRAVFALQRRRARKQGVRSGQVGAVSFLQFFGSALQVTPHFHALVPDGVFVAEEGQVHFEALGPPTQGEVRRLLSRVRQQVLRLLEKRGALPAQGPEDALQAYQSHSLREALNQVTCQVGSRDTNKQVHLHLMRHFMQSERLPLTHWLCLPPGTVVQDWRLEGCHGHGVYGVVYRAFRVGHESAGPVALKLAVYPWDPRFMREVAVLSLVHHPSVPGLLGHGFWRHPSGSVFPFVVMQWVEGTPLYAWAREHRRSPRQVLQVLGQLARALQATHEAHAVHRDVKGENIQVRSSDGLAMLLDFGTGYYPEAARLTWQPVPPGTPAYQPPEAALFQFRAVSSSRARYLAGPADDVFALGVTAYRLVTGDYPSVALPLQDGDGSWRMVETGVRPPSALNPQVGPALSALILQMLSLEPGVRGTAAELAEALEALEERAREEEGPVLEARQAAQEAEAARPRAEGAAAVTAPVAPVRPRVRVRAVVTGSALALISVFLVLWAWQVVQGLPEGASPEEQVASGPGRPDAGSADLGDTAAAAPLATVHEPSKSKPEAVGQERPPGPLPGQIRPNAKGQCPGSKQVAINGGCWVEYPATNAGECAQNSLLPFKNRCYGPAMDSRREPPPTSDQPR